VPEKLGAGTKQDPINIMLTSKALENCQFLSKGVFKVDGTYRLTKNNCHELSGAADKHGQFHPIAFMISNQETENSFFRFFNGIVKAANRMNIECEPNYVMIDASDATYSSAKAIFPYATILIYYFKLPKATE
jgi:hypothetical protein